MEPGAEARGRSEAVSVIDSERAEPGGSQHLLYLLVLVGALVVSFAELSLLPFPAPAKPHIHPAELALLVPVRLPAVEERLGAADVVLCEEAEAQRARGVEVEDEQASRAQRSGHAAEAARETVGLDDVVQAVIERHDQVEGGLLEAEPASVHHRRRQAWAARGGAPNHALRQVNAEHAVIAPQHLSPDRPRAATQIEHVARSRVEPGQKPLHVVHPPPVGHGRHQVVVVGRDLAEGVLAHLGGRLVNGLVCGRRAEEVAQTHWLPPPASAVASCEKQ